MRDKFFAGTIGGMLGATVMAALDFLLNLIPGVNMKLIFGVAELFVPKSLYGTLQGATIGFIAHLACGAVVGLVVLIMLETTGYNHLLLKGVIVGLLSWFLLCGLVARILGLGMQDKFIDNVLMILIHIPFGIVTVYLIYRFRDIRKEQRIV